MLPPKRTFLKWCSTQQGRVGRCLHLCRSGRHQLVRNRAPMAASGQSLPLRIDLPMVRSGVSIADGHRAGQEHITHTGRCQLARGSPVRAGGSGGRGGSGRGTSGSGMPGTGGSLIGGFGSGLPGGGGSSIGRSSGSASGSGGCGPVGSGRSPVSRFRSSPDLAASVPSELRNRDTRFIVLPV